MILPSFAVIASWQSPKMSLEVPRVRSPQAAVWQHALAGDVPALQRAFQEGSASPSDIHGPTGRTLLHVRLIVLHHEVNVVVPTDWFRSVLTFEMEWHGANSILAGTAHRSIYRRSQWMVCHSAHSSYLTDHFPGEPQTPSGTSNLWLTVIYCRATFSKPKYLQQ